MPPFTPNDEPTVVAPMPDAAELEAAIAEATASAAAASAEDASSAQTDEAAAEAVVQPDAATPQGTPPQAAAGKRAPGTVMWQFPKQLPGQAYSTTALRGCSVAFGKTQFAVCLGNRLVGLDWKNSGLEELWTCDVGGHVPGSPVLGPDGLIRVHSGDGWLHCIDQNGYRVWEPVPVGEPLGWSSPVVDLNNNTYVSGYGGGIYRVGPRGDFRNRPYFRTRQKFDSTGLIYRGVLYIGCEDAYLYAIQLSEDEGKNSWDPLEGQGRTEWFINSGPALAPDSSLVVAGRDENLYGFYLDGKQAWKLYIPGQMLASPTVAANGDIFVCLSVVRAGQRDRGRLVCVDGATHRIRWEFEAKGAVESTPVVGDDQIVYFGDNTGHLYAVRGDGHCLWRQQIRVPIRSAGNIVGPNRLVFGLDNGTIAGFLCSSGGVSKKGWPKYMAR